MCLILIIAGRDQIFLNVSPSSFDALQGPLENDLVVHVALVAESQRYEMHSSVGRVGNGCFLFIMLRMAVEINLGSCRHIIVTLSVIQHTFHV